MSENETPETPQPAADPSEHAADGFDSPVDDDAVVPPEPVSAPGADAPAPGVTPLASSLGGHLLPTDGVAPTVPPAAPPAGGGAPGFAPPYTPQAGQPGSPGYPAPDYPASGYPPQGYSAPGYPASGYPAGYPASGHPGQDVAPGGNPYSAPGGYAAGGAMPPGSADGQPSAPGEGGPAKKLPRGAIIGLVAGGAVVVLALAAGIAVPLITGGGGGESRPSAELSEPEQLVFDYLTALSEGDATAARKFVESDTYDQSLLTDEVLAISLEAGPIADIEVGRSRAGEYDSISVPVTFTIGGEEVSRTFEVWELGDEFLLVDGVERIPNYGFEALPLSVNGVEIGDDAVIFPGTYELTVDSEYFEVEGGESIVIDGGANSPSMYSLSPELSDAGIEAYRELVGASLQECLDMKTLSTPCGLSVEDAARDGFTPVDGTVVRTLTAEGKSQIAALEARVSENAVVTTWDYIEIDMSFDATDGSETRSMTAFGGSDLKEPKVDFAAETPTVVWE